MGCVVHTGARINAYMVFVGNGEGRSLHIRPKCRWGVFNIKIYLNELGWGEDGLN